MSKGYMFLVLDDVPEVLPEDRWHDGWDGAAGAEIRGDAGHYEPYPHRWDETLRFCRNYFAIYYKMLEELNTQNRSIERIPQWIVRRALPGLRREL